MVLQIFDYLCSLNNLVMEIEELKEMKPAKFGFYYGTIFGGGAFLYHLLAQYIGFNTNFFYGLIYSFFVLFSLMWIMKKYISLQEPEKEIGFSTFMKLGTIFSLVISFFYLVFSFARIEFIDPNIMNMMVEISEEVAAEMGMSTVDFAGADSIYLYVSFLLTNFLGDFLGNMFYVLILALILKNRNV